LQQNSKLFAASWLGDGANAAPTPFEGDRPCQNGGLQHRTVCSESFPHTGKARLLPVLLWNWAAASYQWNPRL